MKIKKEIYLKKKIIIKINDVRAYLGTPSIPKLNIYLI